MRVVTVNTGSRVWMSLQFLVGAIVGLVLAISSAHAASDTMKAVGSRSAGGTSVNPKPLTLPLLLNGAANTCLVTSGTIDSVGSRGAETFTINGVSYINQLSNQMPARINGNYYIRYVA
jgi:hypothetical protein